METLPSIIKRNKPSPKPYRHKPPSELLKGVPKDPNTLTIMERRFVELKANIGDDGEPIHSNTQAAIKAGFSRHSAAMIGCHLMKKPKVINAIEKRIARKFKKFDITSDLVLQELAAIASANHDDFYDDDGRLIPIKDLPRHVSAAIKEVEVQMTLDEYGRPAAIQKIKLHDKKGCLDLLGKNLRLWQDKGPMEGLTLNVGVSQDKEARAKQSIDDLMAQLKAEREVNEIIEKENVE